MDPNINTSQQPVSPQVQTQVQTQDQNVPVAQPVQPLPQAPTTAVHKEAEPFSTDELIKPSEPEPTLHEEVENAGVEAKKEVPNLTLEDKKAGLTLAKESTPVTTQPTGITRIMTQEEAEKEAKNKKAGNSIVWLATLILRQFKVMHQKLQKSEN